MRRKFVLQVTKFTAKQLIGIRQRIHKDRYIILINKLPKGSQFCIQDTSRNNVIYNSYSTSDLGIVPSYLKEWVNKLNCSGLSAATRNPNRTHGEMKVIFPNKLTLGVYRQYKYDPEKDDL